MSQGNTTNNRAQERRVFDERRSGDPSRSPVTPGSRYAVLARVSIRNTYYNNSDARCPDFQVYPTGSTRLLMATLGLLLKDEGVGFSVLYDANREENLFSYLRQQAERGIENPDIKGVWTRLSFALSLTNPYFINFTSISVDTEPTRLNFYFSNQYAHEGMEGEVILNQGRWVAKDERLPVIPTQLSVPVSEDVKFVRVNAISGLKVIKEPRCVARMGPVVSEVDEPRVTDLDTHVFCASMLFLDFSLLPEDKYIVEKIGYNRRPVGEPQPVLYTAPYPTPLCFIDLLFTDPRVDPLERALASDEGIYPVRDLWSPNAAVVAVDYHLDFRRRRTFWNYYIVPQPDSERLVDLRIVDVTKRDPPDSPPDEISFAGPCSVRLPNGSKAYRFISRQRLPLEEQSRFRFQLRGRRKGVFPIEQVLIERLPVASGTQVLPMTQEAVCGALKASLCQGAEMKPACQELIAEVCDDTGEDQLGGLPEKAVYSEIYVYV